jgi:short-subunit dehydrogenase
MNIQGNVRADPHTFFAGRRTMKTFLSIGAGAGMGLATAERFAREGYRVILSARSEAKIRELASQLTNKGHEVDVRSVDAGNPASVSALVSQTESRLGGIDVLHFNAASMRKATLVEQPRDTFISDLAVNVGGALAAAQAAAPKMIARASGSILLTGGGYALHPNPEYLSLSIGKAGIRALAHGAFESFKKLGVHIATVTIAGSVSNDADAAGVAEQFWRLHAQPIGSWEAETIYTPAG